MVKRQSSKLSPEERFWNRVDRSNEDGCWLYPFRTVNMPGKTTATPARLAYSLILGEIEKTAVVHHHCGQVRCCNPKHMFLNESRRDPFPTVEERFWASIDATSTPEGCWEWRQRFDTGGYGLISYRGRSGEKAHRASYMINVGEIPKGYFVCHKCDNPKCCRPDHLFLGTPAENMLDKARKDRAGVALTPDKARLILRLHGEGLSNRRIAQSTDSSITAVWNVTSRRSWKHL